MPIVAEPIDQVSLNGIDAVQDWIHETQSHLRRIPIVGVLSNKGVFNDDEYLGDGDVMWRFNDRGIRSFCQRIGFRFDQLAKLETPSLASQVLNDLLQQNEIRSRLAEDEVVLDERTNTIIGIVSRTYISYTNEQFLADINQFLISLAKDDAFQFDEAYGINTELTVRFRSEKRHGTIKGRGGAGEDRSLLGLDFQNSMVGTSSVRINYFLHRLVCANGMMVPAGKAINRVFHSGRDVSFQDRLNRRLKEVVRKLDCLTSMLQALASRPFDPERLAQDNHTCRQVFEVIPASKQTICEGEKLALRYASDASEGEKGKMKRAHDAQVIGLIPKYFGGEFAAKVFETSFRDNATMFDFVNVFTEYAKSRAPAQRLEIEEKAGTLAKYIAENARKF